MQVPKPSSSSSRFFLTAAPHKFFFRVASTSFRSERSTSNDNNEVRRADALKQIAGGVYEPLPVSFYDTDIHIFWPPIPDLPLLNCRNFCPPVTLAHVELLRCTHFGDPENKPEIKRDFRGIRSEQGRPIAYSSERVIPALERRRS